MLINLPSNNIFEYRDTLTSVGDFGGDDPT